MVDLSIHPNRYRAYPNQQNQQPDHTSLSSGEPRETYNNHYFAADQAEISDGYKQECDGSPGYLVTAMSLNDNNPNVSNAMVPTQQFMTSCNSDFGWLEPQGTLTSPTFSTTSFDHTVLFNDEAIHSPVSSSSFPMPFRDNDLALSPLFGNQTNSFPLFSDNLSPLIDHSLSIGTPTPWSSFSTYWQLNSARGGLYTNHVDHVDVAPGRRIIFSNNSELHVSELDDALLAGIHPDLSLDSSSDSPFPDILAEENFSFDAMDTYDEIEMGRTLQEESSESDQETPVSLHILTDMELIQRSPSSLSNQTTLCDSSNITQNITIHGETSLPASPDYSNSSPNGPESPGSMSVKYYDCSIENCNKSFEKRYQLNKHRNTHFPKHKCHYDKCYKAFAVKRDRDRHEMDRHSSDPKFACPIDGCKRQKALFKRDDNLLRHLEKVHSLDKEQRNAVLKGRS